MPSHQKRISKQTLAQRRQHLLRLLNRSEAGPELDGFSDFFSEHFHQLMRTPRGPARARLLRYLTRRSSEADWVKLATIVDELDRLRRHRMERETNVLSLRDLLIEGDGDPSTIFGDSLSESDSNQLKKYIQDARRYGATPMGKGARTRILKLIRRIGQSNDIKSS